MSYGDFAAFIIAIATMLLVAHAMTRLGRRVKCPSIVGELSAGIFLGPTVFGILSPDTYHTLYATDDISFALNGLFNISAIMLLFLAGSEIQPSLITKYKKVVMYVTFMGMIVPFVSGFAIAWCFPYLFKLPACTIKWNFAVFLGIALSMSALPVIANILIDLRLIKTKVGTVIIASAMLTDIIGWISFATVTKMQNQAHTMISVSHGLGYNAITTLASIFLVIIFSKYCIHRLATQINAGRLKTKNLLPISLIICLLYAIFTESVMHVHYSLGAFIAGITLGQFLKQQKNCKRIIGYLVRVLFAPLFFVSIGTKLNLIKDLDVTLTLTIVILAFLSKILGATLGAYWGGFSIKNSLLVGTGINARGAIEIILATLALSIGLITPTIFVSLTIMALVTTAISGIILKQFSHKL